MHHYLKLVVRKVGPHSSLLQSPRVILQDGINVLFVAIRCEDLGLVQNSHELRHLDQELEKGTKSRIFFLGLTFDITYVKPDIIEQLFTYSWQQLVQ